MLSDNSDFAKGKLVLGKDPPGEVLKLTYLNLNNYIQGLGYRDLFFVTRVTATNKNF